MTTSLIAALFWSWVIYKFYDIYFKPKVSAKFTKILLLFTLMILIFVAIVAQNHHSQDYEITAIEDPQGNLSKVVKVPEIGFQMLFPRSWSQVRPSVRDSIFEIRSEFGNGGESINLIISELGDSSDITLNDIKNIELPSFYEVLNTNEILISEIPALMTLGYMDINKVGVNNSAISLRSQSNSRLIGTSVIAYQFKLLIGHKLVSLTLGITGQTKEEVLSIFDEKIQIFDEIINSITIHAEADNIAE